MMKSFTAMLSLSIGLVLMSASAMADKLIYTPVNPSFGGNPANGGNLLNEANAQNPFKDPTTDKSTLDSFSDALKTALQNKQVDNLAGGAASAKLGDTFTLGNLKGIVVNEGSGKLAWLITDTSTGKSTYVEIGGL